MCIIRADIWTDTIFANSQFRKFMGRPCAEAGMIRQPLIFAMSALPIELPALWGWRIIPASALGRPINV